MPKEKERWKQLDCPSPGQLGIRKHLFKQSLTELEEKILQAFEALGYNWEEDKTKYFKEGTTTAVYLCGEELRFKNCRAFEDRKAYRKRHQ